jgi:hypothetical protein
MDKQFLIRVNNSFKQIKTQLLLNEKIRSYLYWDDVENNSTPPIEVVKDYVYTQPVVDVETVEPFDKKNYITITLPQGEKDDNRVDYIIRIIVMSDKNNWNVGDDIRPLILSQEIINTLDGYKTYFSGFLSFDSLVETITTKDVMGYSLLFVVSDGVSDVYEK